MADEFRELGGDRAIVFGQKDLSSLRAMQGTLQRLGNGAVLINYLITENRLHILLTTPESQIHRFSEITISDLNQKIFGLRRKLFSPETDPLPLAREMYDLMIEPIADDLRQAGAKTLMVSLDDARR